MIPSTANPADRLRICAVSYLNTVPLVWGMLHGAQRGLFDLSFCVPSECAARLASGDADIGIVPVIELARQDLQLIPGAGIACRGPVRSILLISKVPPRQIRTLAADCSSRTSVMLARILLDRCFGVRPEFLSRPPVLESMLQQADAALVIGDPALLIEPAAVPYTVLDLGSIWTEMTGLPMVFAVWAGRKGRLGEDLPAAFLESYRFGMEHLDDIVSREAPARGISADLARQYLTRNIVFELGEREYEGMRAYLNYSEAFDILVPTGSTSS